MSGRRKWIYGALAAVLLPLALLAWNWSALRAQAQVGAGFGARVTCSCRYVEGRSMESCKGDKEPGMWAVSLKDLPESQSVNAAVPLLASRTARYRKGWGCLLDP
ncbi:MULTISPECIES: hypothetical protein [Sphingobium]|uniref:Uncharacterized protein n=2 Tax=Sphingobium indicum TaxID=332055 RepID=D4YXC0_SPHIU|nr:hypothetical protein [Sphingobium indicum]APL96093.1 hypothetical protein SIDU_17100 [Sphingobium indicum B90A]KEY99536.1 hypothetical protein AI27_02920 [Sphingomonas sp. BHC-A]NYI24140.1 hypothetical protein [Sphingobium indicum]BAI95002.1 hypothetical protein SJA_C1-01680 [Sphingobium indicum UT26S]